MNFETFIDLHTHSNASDGSFSPSQIIELAEQKGLSVVALTDHDSVNGIDEFIEAASKKGLVTAVPGVEFSASFQNTEVHILGLFVDYKSESLSKMLFEIRENRKKRNLLIIEKLRALNYEINYDELMATAGNDCNIGRPHFARILIEKGYFTTVQEVFDKCLKRGATAFCSRVLPKPREAIDEIHKAGGLAFWAHPVFRRDDEKHYVRKAVKRLISMGIDGIEAFYTSYTPEQHKLIYDTAIENNLLVCGGSDFHGRNQPAIELGTGFGTLKVPYSVYENLMVHKATAQVIT